MNLFIHTLGAVGTPLYLALTTEQDIGEDGPLDAASSKSLADGVWIIFE